MYRTLFLVLTVVFLLTALTAWAIHETIPAETGVIPPPGPDAAKLLDYINKTSPYQDWKLWPGKGKLYPGREPHGALLTTYVNELAYRGIRDKKGIPDAGIIVKENYSGDKKLMATTVMYKIDGYNPQGGDYFWAKYAPDGKVLESGKLKGCIDCHGQKKENDYIWTGPVK